ncbi:MAG: hypothetical protein P8Y70_03290 [Candidatus Lokiarchaeota archaeon]
MRDEKIKNLEIRIQELQRFSDTVKGEQSKEIEEMRNAYHQEIEELKKEYQNEKQELQAKINELDTKIMDTRLESSEKREFSQYYRAIKARKISC